MRAVMHLKTTNLSWHSLLSHVKACGMLINSSFTPRIEPKKIYNANTERQFDESNKLLKNIKTIKKMSQSIKIDNENIQSNELFADRLIQQLAVIEQIPQDYFAVNNSLEYTVHSCSQSLKQEFKTLFVNHDVSAKDSTLSVLCLNHHTFADMSLWDSAMALERENLAQIFISTAKDICKSLTACGFWADFIDPYSGTAFLGGDTEDRLLETDARMRHFGLDITDLGCCKVLSHPLWKENVFTGIIFTDAPYDHPLLSSVNTL